MKEPLNRVTWTRVARTVATGPNTLLVPLGATEQHGRHLPLGTDSVIATALAAAAALRVPEAVAAPLLPYGSSGEHQDFPGTLSIGAAATELVLVELARSAAHTYERVVFVNAHGGNAAPLARAVERLRLEGRDARAWSPSWRGDAHAGRVETSVMLAIAPGSVGSDRGAGNVTPLRDLIDDLRATGVRSLSPNGVLGDPRGACAAEGQQLLAAAVADLVEVLAGRPVTTEVG